MSLSAISSESSLVISLAELNVCLSSQTRCRNSGISPHLKRSTPCLSIYPSSGISKEDKKRVIREKEGDIYFTYIFDDLVKFAADGTLVDSAKKS